MPSERAEKDEPCEHGIRWPWACDDCDRAEWADHQAQLAATPPPASADALGEVERVARAIEDALIRHDVTDFSGTLDDATAALSAMSPAGEVERERKRIQDAIIALLDGLPTGSTRAHAMRQCLKATEPKP